MQIGMHCGYAYLYMYFCTRVYTSFFEFLYEFRGVRCPVLKAPITHCNQQTIIVARAAAILLTPSNLGPTYPYYRDPQEATESNLISGRAAGHRIDAVGLPKYTAPEDQ